MRPPILRTPPPSYERTLRTGVSFAGPLPPLSVGLELGDGRVGDHRIARQVRPKEFVDRGFGVPGQGRNLGYRARRTAAWALATQITWLRCVSDQVGVAFMRPAPILAIPMAGGLVIARKRTGIWRRLDSYVATSRCPGSSGAR